MTCIFLDNRLLAAGELVRQNNLELLAMTLRIILGIVIVAAVIAGGVYISDYFNHSFVADALSSQIQNQNHNLDTLSDQTRELNTEITDNTANVNNLLYSIANESTVIPSEKIDPNDIIRAILEQGQKNLVTVIPLNTEGWSSVKTNGVDFQVFKLSLEVNGSMENLVEFVRQTQSLYSTLVIDNISLYKYYTTPVPAVMPAGERLSPPIPRIAASLSLVIYSKS
jgi:hypothetical protein